MLVGAETCRRKTASEIICFFARYICPNHRFLRPRAPPTGTDIVSQAPGEEGVGGRREGGIAELEMRPSLAIRKACRPQTAFEQIESVLQRACASANSIFVLTSCCKLSALQLRDSRSATRGMKNELRSLVSKAELLSSLCKSTSSGKGRRRMCPQHYHALLILFLTTETDLGS